MWRAFCGCCATGRDLPAEYPSGVTCWRRLRQWEEVGIGKGAWEHLLAHLNQRQLLDWNEVFLDATLITAKKGALQWAQPGVERAQSTWWWSDGQGIPLGVQLASASPSEHSLAEGTLAQVRVPRLGRGRPRTRLPRVIADRGYDSDALRQRLRQRGTELIVSYRSNSVLRRFEDRRKLRRYRRRWKIERAFAWLQNLRRLLVRHDRILTVYQGFFHLACLIITLRHL